MGGFLSLCWEGLRRGWANADFGVVWVEGCFFGDCEFCKGKESVRIG